MGRGLWNRLTGTVREHKLSATSTKLKPAAPTKASASASGQSQPTSEYEPLLTLCHTCFSRPLNDRLFGQPLACPPLPAQAFGPDNGQRCFRSACAAQDALVRLPAGPAANHTRRQASNSQLDRPSEPTTARQHLPWPAADVARASADLDGPGGASRDGPRWARGRRRQRLREPPRSDDLTR
jgi:hypothetical protein